ncbi:MAG TPA: phosphonate ABC transporter, permease protein PhnE [Puia sp.]|jgi:phosphonate transport system permease protein|nr:phosphonate ABC transporter, permease protein PhnE [Puia sp.]
MKAASRYTLSPASYRQRATIFTVMAIGIGLACVFMGFDPSMLFTEFHYLVDLGKSMTPPNLPLLWTDRTIFMALLETLSMAFLGTLVGGSIAVTLAFLAAANTMPFRGVRMLVRVCLSLQRVIPSLFVILIFVAAVGLGPFAGMLTLMLSTVGTFGQLFMEIIENTEPAPADAVYAAGATRWQVIRYAILPQTLPSFTANFFYAYDINVRAAIGLGIFGGGGVGFQLFQAMRLLHYRDALALICLTMLLIVLTEKISDTLRARLLGGGGLK